MNRRHRRDPLRGQPEQVRPKRPGIRLQKFLADRGLGSRRKIERWITDGRISVDGRRAQLGDRVNERSKIKIDGRHIRGDISQTSSRVLLYNKPEGEICSRSDPEKRPTVFRNLPKQRGARWVAVGRLDINTRGLLLFTNNGDLANRLMHPGSELEREYLCRIFGKVDENAIERLKSGIQIDGTWIKFKRIKRQRGEGSNTWYNVVVTEGKYREVRRLWEAVDCRVSRLVRIRYGNVTMPKNLKQGEWTELKPSAITRLLEPGSPTEEHKRNRSPQTRATAPARGRPEVGRPEKGRRARGTSARSGSGDRKSASRQTLT